MSFRAKIFAEQELYQSPGLPIVKKIRSK